MTNQYFAPIAIAPWETIKELCEEKQLSLDIFAFKIDFSNYVSIVEQNEITEDMALKLESVLEVPAKFFLDLDSQYRETLVRLKRDS
ncbi:transcriptional regulator [Paenibacillus sp. CFBP13512]|uniref:transcriptional regulator n=1 Tax=Paenibacillus sp. CFBP13512 TaxID=2184007 RepID=UPI0010C08821|nr:transcriptional regulator [Paenibacillus sp. CFBP13512]TKJ87241.1 transcriptional regulator [Paenibacillus sp. CFBP13512]